MSRFHCAFALLTAASLSIPLSACSQDPPQEEAAGGETAQLGVTTTDVAALEAEYGSIQQRLSTLQQKAMQDTLLQAEFASLQGVVEEAMNELDPQTPLRRERLAAIQSEVQEAEQSGEAEDLQQLLVEGTSLERQIQQTQTQALQQDGVFEKMNAFQDKIVARMTEMDPEVPALLERVGAIVDEFRASEG